MHKYFRGLVLIISLVLVFYSFYLIINGGGEKEKFDASSFEYENVDHSSLSMEIEDFYKILPDKTELKRIIEEDSGYIFVFLTASDDCANCLNEISDYLEIKNTVVPLSGKSHSFIYYYGDDSVKSERYFKVSNMNGMFDGSEYLDLKLVDILELIDTPLSANSNNLLFLLDPKKSKVFHVFVLPAVRTSKFEVKKEAVITAIKSNNNNKEIK